MRIFMATGSAAVILGLILGTPTYADPPQLTGPNGPAVQFWYGPEVTSLLTSERGLSIAVGDLADLVVEYDDGTGPQALHLFGATGGIVGPPRPALYAAADSGSFTVPDDPFATSYADTFGFRLTRTTLVAVTSIDGSVTVQARIGTAGPVLATASGPTVEAARAAVLANAALDGVRSDITSMQLIAAAPTVTTTEVTTSALTGRDTYLLVALTIGPNAPHVVLSGNIGQCAVFLTDCDGGTGIIVPNLSVVINTITLQDLYITDTLTRVVTTMQNYILNLFIAGADGTPHVAAQAVALNGAEGFLARMLVQAQAGNVAPQVSSGPGAGAQVRSFAVVSGVAGAFDQIGSLQNTNWSQAGLTAGLVWTTAPAWRFGVAVELGQWSWAGPGEDASGDSQRFGGFANRDSGPWTLGLSAFAGKLTVKSRDALDATAHYDVAQYGAAVEAGYTLTAGGWQLTPSVALRWLTADAPAFTDSAGGQFDAAHISQLRPEIGLRAARSFALGAGVVDLGLDARFWTVSDDHIGVTSGGVLTQGGGNGPGGSLGLSADWQISANTTLRGAVGRRFSDAGDMTTAEIGLVMQF